MDPWVRSRKFGAMRQAEADGKVADSMDYRLALMQRVHSGEITLEQAQTELKRVKRNAKKNGLTTRNSVFVHS